MPRVFIRRFALAAALLLWAAWLDARANPIRREWRRLTSKDGLADTWCTSIAEDNAGRLWIGHGSVKAVSVYDGYEVRTVPWEGFDRPIIRQDAAGRYWGFRYKPFIYSSSETPQTYPFYRLISSNWAQIDIHDITDEEWSYGLRTIRPHPTDSNRLLILLNNRLLEYGIDQNRCGLILSASDTELGLFNDLFTDGDSHFWIAAHGGLARSNLKNAGGSSLSGGWTQYPFPPETRFADGRHPFEKADGQIIISAKVSGEDRSAILGFADGRWTPLMHLPRIAIAAWPNHSGGYWTIASGERDWAIHRADPQWGIQEIDNPSAKIRILDVVRKPDGSFFLTNRNGVAQYVPPLWNKMHGKITDQDIVYSINEDKDGNIWATINNNLVKIGENNAFTIRDIGYKSWLVKNSSNGVEQLQSGAISAGNIDGIVSVFDQELERFTHIRIKPRLYADYCVPNRDGTIYTTAFHFDELSWHLFRFDGHEFTAVQSPLDTSYTANLRDILKDSKGNLWLGGVQRLARLVNGTVIPQTDYPGHGAFCLLEPNDGGLLVGAKDEIFAYDGESWDAIRPPGLERVYAMDESSDGTLWIATTSGVHRYQNGVWIHNDYYDGLPDAACKTLFVDSRGRVWAGTDEGLYRYDPGADPDPPETYVLENDNIHLVSSEGEARISIRGMDKWNHTTPDRLLYSHRFDGGAWSPYSPDTILSASGLARGAHVLEVRALDRNGNADPAPAVFRFAVEPPWYLVPQAQVLGAAASLAILSLLALSLKRQKQLASLLGEQGRRLREAEDHLVRLSEEEQRRIGRELHDGIAQDLAAISYMGETIIEDFHPRHPGEAGQLNTMLTVLRDTREKVRGLAGALSPFTLHERGLPETLSDVCDQARRRFKIPCEFDNGAELDAIPRDQSIHVLRIVQEALHNAARHGSPSRIEVRAKQRNGAAEIAVEDDGRGFGPDRQTGGLGLAIMRHRAEIIGARLAIEPRPEGGVRVALTVPPARKEG